MFRNGEKMRYRGRKVEAYQLGSAVTASASTNEEAHLQAGAVK
jgi:hypothetical protein